MFVVIREIWIDYETTFIDAVFGPYYSKEEANEFVNIKKNDEFTNYYVHEVFPG